MTPGERCDEILRLIDEILDETRNGAPAPIRLLSATRCGHEAA